MFEWLVHSKTRLKMMKLFFRDPESPLYGLEIAQTLKASPGTTHRELNAMLKQGIITKKKEGALVMYRLNTKHPYFGELKKAVFPSKKTMRVLFMSDLHLSAETPQSLIDDLYLFLDYAEDNANEIVFVGDMVEMLKGDLFSTYLVHKPLFDRIEQLSHELKITYLVGNHDCYLQVLTQGEKAGKLMGSRIVFADQYYHQKLNIFATHGHSYDDFSEMGKETKGKDSALAEAIKKAKGADTTHLKQLKKLSEYATQATQFAQYVSKKKVDYSTKFQNIAKDLIDSEDYSYVVLGHTHKAQLKQMGHGVYFNTGSWKSEKKRHFVEIDKDGGALVAMSDLK